MIIEHVQTLYRDTKCSLPRVRMAVDNLTKNKIWDNGFANVDIGDDKTELENIIEIVLCTLCAMGEINRVAVETTYPVPALLLPAIPIPLPMLQMLAEVKKVQLERESKPYEFRKYND